MKKIYTILSLHVAGLLVSAQAADPVLHYALDAGTGTTAVNSGTVGASANGTLTGAGSGWVADSPSGLGSSYSTASGNSYIQAGVLPALSVVGDFTMTMWLKFSAVEFNDRLMSTRGVTSTGFIDLLAADGSSASALTLSLQMMGPGATGITGTAVSDEFDVTDWTFLSVVRDGGAVTFNIGSVLDDVALLSTSSGHFAGTIGQDASNFEIAGTSATGKARSPDGVFNDFRFYTEALSLGAINGIQQSVIPEPSATMMLSVIGVIAVGLRRRRVAK